MAGLLVGPAPSLRAQSTERLLWLKDWKAVYVPEGEDPHSYVEKVLSEGGGSSTGWLSDLFSSAPEEAKLARLEEHLEEASKQYEEWGFQGADIARVEANGDLYSLAVVQPSRQFSGSGYGFYQPLCAGGHDGAYRRGWLGGGAPIFVNPALLGGHWSFRYGSTTAHELFHAVQSAYHGSEPCPPDWVTEGTADAMALSVAEARGLLDFGRDGPDQKEIAGLRPYHLPLNGTQSWDRYRSGAERAQVDYATSSFWRWLNEAYDSWSFLEALLETPVTGSDGAPKNSVAWVEEGLKSVSFPELEGRAEPPGLHYFLPQFLAEYALWGRDRYDDRPIEGGDWLEEAFGGCIDVTISPREPAQTVRVELRRLAGRCLRVVPLGFEQRFLLRAVADVDDPRLAEQLHLGVDGVVWPGEAVSANGRGGGRVSRLEGTVGKVWKANMDLGLQSVEPLLMVMTSVAPRPERTREDVEVKLTLAAETWEANLPDPPPQTRDGPGEASGGFPAAPAPSAPTGRNEGDEQSLQFLHRTDVGMELGPETGCGDPRLDRMFGALCGPKMTISLGRTIQPPDDAILGGDGAPGEAYGNLMEWSRDVRERVEELEREESVGVSIQLPAIDYGQTGNYPAVVTLSQPGPDGVREKLESVHGERGVTATVTVEAFSPAFLRGSFEGTVYGTTRRNGRPVSRTEEVSGRFSAAAPVDEDPRAEGSMTEAERMRAAYLSLGLRGDTPGGQPVAAIGRLGGEWPAETAPPEGEGGGGAAAPDADAEAPADEEGSDCVHDGVVLVEDVAPELCPALREAYENMSPEQWKAFKKAMTGGGS